MAGVACCSPFVQDPFLQSRSLKPLARYVPDIVAAARDVIPVGAVADGELVIWDPFDGPDLVRASSEPPD